MILANGRSRRLFARPNRSLLRCRPFADVGRRNPARALADAKLRLRRQHELGVNQNVALGELAIRIGDELDMPLSRGRLYLRTRLAEEASAVAAQPGRVVQAIELLAQGANRLLLKNGDDAFETRELGGMDVDDVPAWRQRGISERLQVAPHVLHDGGNQIACGPASIACDGGAVVGYHVVRPLKAASPTAPALH